MTAAEFEQLYRATARDVFSYVRRRTSADAEDLVAETYAVAWRRRADLPAPMLRRAWLFGVARTLLRAQVREQRTQADLVRQLATQRELDAEPPELGAVHPEVTAALARLGPEAREILQLVTWEGLTPAELAVVLGVRPGTARVRLHRARQAFAADPGIQAHLEGLNRQRTAPSPAPGGSGRLQG